MSVHRELDLLVEESLVEGKVDDEDVVYVDGRGRSPLRKSR